MTAGDRLTICVVGNAKLPHVAERARAVAERGHRVFLVSELPGEVPGVVVVVPKQRLAVRKVGVLQRARAIVKAIEGSCADIVHVHFAHGFPAWVAPAARNRPLVVSVMGGDVLFEERDVSPRDRRLTGRLLKAADLITAKSNFLSDAVAKIAPEVPRLRVMWGVDTNLFKPGDPASARRRLGLPEAGFFVLSPRGLSPLYNIETIVSGFAKAFQATPEAWLLIVEHHPDLEYRQHVRDLAGALGIADRTRFLPARPGRDMPLYYAASDLAVSAPLSDGLPQTLLEAMSCGRAHVLPPLPRYGEVVTHEREVLFASATAEGLGEAFARLFREPALVRHLGQAARATAVRVADRERELDAMERAYLDRIALAQPRSSIARMLYFAAVLWEHVRE